MESFRSHKGPYMNYNDPNPYANMNERLWIVQEGLCFHCNEPMLLKVSRSNLLLRWSREHVIPKARGGKRENNIVLAHRSCNSARNHEPLSPADLERAYQIIEKAKSLHHVIKE